MESLLWEPSPVFSLFVPSYKTCSLLNVPWCDFSSTSPGGESIGLATQIGVSPAKLFLITDFSQLGLIKHVSVYQVLFEPRKQPFFKNWLYVQNTDSLGAVLIYFSASLLPLPHFLTVVKRPPCPLRPAPCSPTPMWPLPPLPHS